jgi:hypothetical protein
LVRVKSRFALYSASGALRVAVRATDVFAVDFLDVVACDWDFLASAFLAVAFCGAPLFAPDRLAARGFVAVFFAARLVAMSAARARTMPANEAASSAEMPEAAS